MALLEPGSSWAVDEPAHQRSTATETSLHRREGGGRAARPERSARRGRAASTASRRSRSSPPATRPGRAEPRPSFDPTLPMCAAGLDATSRAARRTGAPGRMRSRGSAAAGALLAAAEAVGAAERMLDEARRYAGERRQFGRTIGSFQALRHLLADMYVRSASGWSAVLYAAAALDEGADDAARTASIAKAYVSRGRARGRARRDAGLRRHRVHGRAPGPPFPAADRRARAAVRRRRAPRARARSRARRGTTVARARRRTWRRDDRLGSPTRPPSAWSRSPPAPSPRSSGPCSPTALHDPRWRDVRRRADLRRQVEPHLPRRVATPARSFCAARRSATCCRPRTTWSREYRVQSALERHAPFPCRACSTSGTPTAPLGVSFYVMERVVGHICRNALPAGYADS